MPRAVPFAYRAMSVSYAAAVSTPNGRLQQPQIHARACSHDDLRSSFEGQENPQRPGAGVRSKTSFRTWSTKSDKSDSTPNRPSRPMQEARVVGSQPRDEHRPNTESAEDLVYVLTLKITKSLAHAMNTMREQYFPKALNRTPAHLTLFHALPHSQLEALETKLCQVCSEVQPFEISSGRPFRMRKGVGINVDGGYKKMKDVHEQLQSSWLPFLSSQDAGGFRPHWTVMNKVNDEQKVDGAFNAIREQLSAKNQEGQALGLDLWKYDHGKWLWEKEYPFGSPLVKTPQQGHSFGSPNNNTKERTAVEEYVK